MLEGFLVLASFPEANARKVDLDLSTYACWSLPSWGNCWNCGEGISLRGRLPDMKRQFATFDNTNYEGNPFLCGPPLDTSCSTDLPELPPSSNASNGKWHDIVDPVSFLASFVATYVVYVLAYVAVLYVNPYWQRK